MVSLNFFQSRTFLLHATYLNSWNKRFHSPHNVRRPYTHIVRFCIRRGGLTETHTADSSNIIRHSRQFLCNFSTSHLISWKNHRDTRIDHPIPRFVVHSERLMGSQQWLDKHYSSLKWQRRKRYRRNNKTETSLEHEPNMFEFSFLLMWCHVHMFIVTAYWIPQYAII